jgi:hypothetical protein
MLHGHVICFGQCLGFTDFHLRYDITLLALYSSMRYTSKLLKLWNWLKCESLDFILYSVTFSTWLELRNPKVCVSLYSSSHFLMFIVETGSLNFKEWIFFSCVSTMVWKYTLKIAPGGLSWKLIALAKSDTVNVCLSFWGECTLQHHHLPKFGWQRPVHHSPTGYCFTFVTFKEWVSVKSLT